MIEIIAVGGYNEVGKNCTAIKIDNQVILMDLGLHLDSYISYTEDEDLVAIDPDELMKVGAVPNISVLEGWKDKVKLIIPTHAHLDHVGAIPYLGNKFDAPILCTPFTAAVLKTILDDEKLKIKNKIKILNVNSSYKLSDDVTIEFINMTHSTPQTVMVALHTKYGIILYANDFKFDNFPVLGKKPNFERLKEIKGKTLVLICDSTYAGEHKKTPSESVAKQMLKDVLLGTNSKGKAILITTFSSHLARLKSIIKYGKILDRKIVFLGRSLAKYVKAGEEAGLINFSKDVEIVKYGSKIKKKLKEIDKKRKKYLLVVTGHQGEKKATLSKIVREVFPFKLNPEDHVIFSCTVIPSEINIEHRRILEEQLKKYHVRTFRDIHVSGHAAREDLRDLINLVKPKHIIPAHGNLKMRSALADLAYEMGYDKEFVHIVSDSKKISI